MFLASTLECGTTSHHSSSVFVPCSALLCRMNVLKLKSDGDWDSSFRCTGVGYGGAEGSLTTMGENGERHFFLMLFHA